MQQAVVAAEATMLRKWQKGGDITSEGNVVAKRQRNQSVAIMDISHCVVCRCL